MATYRRYLITGSGGVTQLGRQIMPGREIVLSDEEAAQINLSQPGMIGPALGLSTYVPGINRVAEIDVTTGALVNPVPGRSIARPGTKSSVDVLIYGATAAGCQAAIACAKMGVRCVLVSPTGRIGGMVTGGLSRTDYRGYNPRVAMNMGTQDFYRRFARYYDLTLGEFGQFNSGVSQFSGEPHVALEIYQDLLNEYEIPVLYGFRCKTVIKNITQIVTVVLESINGESDRTIFPRVVIDADDRVGLMMRVPGLTWTYGREANATYSETYNGVGALQTLTGNPDPYVVAGDAGSGLLPQIDATPIETAGSADTRLQAYCYRLCMTNDASIRTPVPAPATYHADWYELLGRRMANAPTTFDTLDECFFRATIKTADGKVKQDWNNLAVILDFVGGNVGFAAANYTVQAQIEQNHLDYTLGLFKFFREDSRVPSALKTEMADWGFCKDEFTRSNSTGTPDELYVRESARMVGEYTHHEGQFFETTAVANPVALASYAMDSHACSLRVSSGIAKHEGGLSSSLVPVSYYGIEYQALLPKLKECSNLLCIYGLSATHSAYGSMRMEVTFQSLGEVAGFAASLAIKGNSRIHELTGAILQPYVRNCVINSSRVLTVDAPTTNGTATKSSGAAWTAATFPPDFYGAQLFHDGAGNKGGRYITFQPSLAADGKYRIRLNAPGSTNSQLSVKVTVVHNGGTDNFYIDHKYGEMFFRDIGSWIFTKASVDGGSQYIRVTNLGDPAVSGSSSGNCYVDAIAWDAIA